MIFFQSDFLIKLERFDKIKENVGKVLSGKKERLFMLNELLGIKYRIILGYCLFSIISSFCY